MTPTSFAPQRRQTGFSILGYSFNFTNGQTDGGEDVRVPSLDQITAPNLSYDPSVGLSRYGSKLGQAPTVGQAAAGKINWLYVAGGVGLALLLLRKL